MSKSALSFALSHIRTTWTWQRLTDDERGRMVEALERVQLRGTFREQVEQIYIAEYAFLFDLGYNPIEWRETEK